MSEPEAETIHIEFLRRTNRFVERLADECVFAKRTIVVAWRRMGDGVIYFKCDQHYHYLWPADFAHGYVRVLTPLEYLARADD